MAQADLRVDPKGCPLRFWLSLSGIQLALFLGVLQTVFYIWKRAL